MLLQRLESKFTGVGEQTHIFLALCVKSLVLWCFPLSLSAMCIIEFGIPTQTDLSFFTLLSLPSHLFSLAPREAG